MRGYSDRDVVIAGVEPGLTHGEVNVVQRQGIAADLGLGISIPRPGISKLKSICCNIGN
jgi:hypothetical protein